MLNGPTSAMQKMVTGEVLVLVLVRETIYRCAPMGLG